LNPNDWFLRIANTLFNFGVIMRLIPSSCVQSLLCAAVVFVSSVSNADTGKLKLTGGVSTVDGAAGGGISPWALIGSNATEGEWGVSAFATRIASTDYGLNAYGVAAAWSDKLEVSLAQQDFDTGPTGSGLGLPGLHLKQDIWGVKYRVAGDAILNSDSWMPQLAVGVLYKRLNAAGLEPTLTGALGARTSDAEYYVAATKLLLDKGILLNATLRATRANQNGLLGFGSTVGGNDNYRFMPEVSAAWLLSPSLAIGAEYRKKPNNLEAAGQAASLGNGLREQDWSDLFVAWAPTKNLSLTLARADLGEIIGATTDYRKQTATYLSAQVAF
jgi:Protein of unknown function (DUF3034)